MSFPAVSAAVGFANWLGCGGRVSFLSLGIRICPIIKAARQAARRAGGAGRGRSLVWDLQTQMWAPNGGGAADLSALFR